MNCFVRPVLRRDLVEAASACKWRSRVQARKVSSKAAAHWHLASIELRPCKSASREQKLWSDARTFTAGVDVKDASEEATETLGDHFMDMERSLRPTEEQFLRRAHLEQHMQAICTKLGGDLHCYGSAENGTWMHRSDIDMTWIHEASDMPGDIHSWECDMLKKLREEVDSIGIDCISHMSVITARVPVLKLYGADDEVLCDVTMNNWEGLRNTQLVGSLCREVESLGPLVRLLKHWAQQRGIGDRAHGGFSTYTLVLMAAHYIQSTPCAMFPSGTYLPAKHVERICAEAKQADFRPLAKSGRKEDGSKRFEHERNLSAGFDIAHMLSSFFRMFDSPRFRRGGQVIIDGGNSPAAPWSHRFASTGSSALSPAPPAA